MPLLWDGPTVAPGTSGSCRMRTAGRGTRSSRDNRSNPGTIGATDLEGATMTRRRAFTLIEAAAAVVVVSVLLIVLVPIGSQSRNAGALHDSMQNVATLMAATHRYVLDHAGQPPMRACGYSNGQITGGWDSWNYGGKNADSQSSFWTTNYGGIYDEPAYCRPLNPYVDPERFRVPVGYVNTGSGSTWTFVHGHPTVADRTSVQGDR